MMLMAVIFAFGGSVEVYVYRILGLTWWSGQVLPAMMFWKAALVPAGLLFTAGAVLIAYDFFTFGSHRSAEIPLTRARPGSSWMSGFEFSIWVLVFWVFGFIITGGLLSYGLPSVRAGNAMVPYALAGVGYIGLFASTVVFVGRFLRLFELRQRQFLEQEHEAELHLPVVHSALAD